MLARTIGPNFSSYPCLLQPKLNGVRALAQNSDGAIVMQSRDEKLWRYDFLRELYDELKQLYAAGKSFFGASWNPILDGELYCHGWRLQDINAAIAVNRKERTANTSKVEYHIFDSIPNLQTVFCDRWVGVAYVIQELALKRIHSVPTHHCANAEEKERYFQHYTAAGYEGVMLRLDAPYDVGETAHGTQYRSKSLWKYKHWEDGEFECVGVTPGEGKASVGIGALVLKRQKIGIFDDLKQNTFKVGTGFTDEERIEFMKNPPHEKMVRVRYLELTADGIPFNPSFLAVLS